MATSGVRQEYCCCMAAPRCRTESSSEDNILERDFAAAKLHLPHHSRKVQHISLSKRVHAVKWLL